MNNDPRPKFDPETGRPLTPPPAPKFDPETGRPLTPPPAPKFDPETGRPLTPPPAPQPEQPAQPPQPEQPPQPHFDPETGRPLDPPPAPQSQPQANNAPPAHTPTNGLAVASLCCGILSLICCCCGWFSVILGIGGVVLGIVSKRGEPKMSGMALGGVICGAIGGGLALVTAILSIALSGVAGNFLDELFFRVEDILDTFGYGYYY